MRNELSREAVLELLRGDRPSLIAWDRSRGAKLGPQRAQSVGLLDFSCVDLHGADLQGADLHELDLCGANLRVAKLDGANLSGARLVQADLDRSSFWDCDLTYASLMGASLRDAELRGACLKHASLAFADMLRADLRHADLSSANLLGAYLGGARMGGTHLCCRNLGRTRGLTTAVHYEPSMLGIETFRSAGGKIPGEFLRGCGVDHRIQGILMGDYEALAEATYSAANPMRFESCFISYSTKDMAFVRRLQSALNANGVDYWYAPVHGKWGERLTTQIDEQIALRDRVLLVCSRASLNDSDWVQWELSRAVSESRRRGKELVFPIAIDDAIFEWSHPLATRILELLVGDFRNARKGKAFEDGVLRLLEALRKGP